MFFVEARMDLFSSIEMNKYLRTSKSPISNKKKTMSVTDFYVDLMLQGLESLEWD